MNFVIFLENKIEYFVQYIKCLCYESYLFFSKLNTSNLMLQNVLDFYM